ncbi:4607_t:CDS:10 [Gigaspora margarita]|uniref:4607_t:CDS:1 n=1 Tax=Gigaspora margarita TaxID=4874 RepID=A0ABN7VS28_GIGMA|nr:4607_t:CDS:10 [Gigaspora margarita]
MDKKNVVVLGAGVIGLTTATLLLKQEKGVKVHIIASIFPNDPEALSNEYTSTTAGAHWRGYEQNDPRQQEFEKSTYNYLWELANKNMSNVTGVMVIDEYNYWEKRPDDFGPWFRTVCHEFKELEKNELPDDIEFGIKYKSSGTTEHVKIEHLDECVRENTDILINCSGYGAKTLEGVKDFNLYPVRGQSVIMQLSQSCLDWACFRHSYNGDDALETFIIPRENGEVMLGGTREKDNDSTEIEHSVAQKIIQRCFATRPDFLKDTKVQLTLKGHRVGLRPYRNGGIRVEAELRNCEKSSKEIIVCHNYGHAGVGYQTSYATAQLAIDLIKKKIK